MGVKGMHPLDCLPLWGREGVTFLPSVKNIAKRMDRDRIFPEYIIPCFLVLWGYVPHQVWVTGPCRQ